MIILLVLAVIACVGLCLRDQRGINPTGFGMSFLGGCLLAVGLIISGVEQLAAPGYLAQYEQHKVSVKTARAGSNEDVLGKAAKFNIQLASKKYWNQTVFDIWIPDIVANLEPIDLR